MGGLKKMDFNTKKLLAGIGVLAVLFLFICLPVRAAETAPLGITLLHVFPYEYYRNLSSYGPLGYWHESLTYSKLSTSPQQPPFFMDIWMNRPSGLVDPFAVCIVNFTTAFTYANGSSSSTVTVLDADDWGYSPDLGQTQEPVEFSLQAGDAVTITAIRANSSVTCEAIDLYIQTADEAITTTIHEYPSLEAMTGAFVGIVQTEANVVDQSAIFIGLGMKILLFIVIPVMVLLILMWSIRKLIDGFYLMITPPAARVSRRH